MTEDQANKVISLLGAIHTRLWFILFGTFMLFGTLVARGCTPHGGGL